MSTDRCLPVLLYHNIGPRVRGTNRWLTVSPSRFRSHVQWLAKHGYKGITSREWLGYLRGEAELPPKPVLIAFDDGYRGVAEHALPVLREVGFSATVFLVTRLLGRMDEWEGAEGPTRLPLLSADEVCTWAQQGIEFGSHGRTHVDLRKLQGQALADEVAGSRADLEAVLGREVCSFAYPFGFFNEQVQATAAASYPLCFSTLGGLNDRDSVASVLRRMRIWPAETGLDLHFRIAQGWSPVGSVLSAAAVVKRRLRGLI